jgi:hypothetical protein
MARTLRKLDIPADEDDFIVPGAAPDGHYAVEQQHNFIRDVKLCGRVAADCDPALAFLTKATPYSLRRGHISLRALVREDIRRIADDCWDVDGDDPPALASIHRSSWMPRLRGRRRGRSAEHPQGGALRSEADRHPAVIHGGEAPRESVD